MLTLCTPTIQPSVSCGTRANTTNRILVHLLRLSLSLLFGAVDDAVEAIGYVPHLQLPLCVCSGSISPCFENFQKMSFIGITFVNMSANMCVVGHKQHEEHQYYKHVYIYTYLLKSRGKLAL